VEHFLPRSRHPRLEIAGALFGVLSLTYLITAALRKLPPEVSRHPNAIIPNPLHLLPALIFLVALAGYSRRKYLVDSAFDRSIFRAVWLNLAAQLAACQSEKLLDGPFVFAQAMNVASYTILLGGALLDSAHVFEKVRHLAASDPLTGLANYRRLLDVLDTETERTLRTGRPFAVLLLDLDGLKKINDTHGHLVGSRALCRVADILRFYCRAIDTAARYGGDEFAVVLPKRAMMKPSASLSASAKPWLPIRNSHPSRRASAFPSIKGKASAWRNCWRKLTRISTKKRRGGKPSANLPTLPAAA